MRVQISSVCSPFVSRSDWSRLLPQRDPTRFYRHLSSSAGRGLLGRSAQAIVDEAAPATTAHNTRGNRLAAERNLGHSRRQDDALPRTAVHRLDESPYTGLGQLRSYVRGLAPDENARTASAAVDGTAC